MLKVMTVVGTRPEIIRLSRVITALDKHTQHVLVHTGQNYDYELNEVFFKDLGLRAPDHFLECAGKTAAETIGNVIVASERVMLQEKPDALLVLGDTNSCMAAITAKRHRIPIFHMEAGNRCFDFRVPEEINRRIVDHVADINLTYSEIARGYLLREGMAPDQVIRTGSPMREILNHHAAAIDASDVLERMSLGEHNYFLVSAHREENVDDLGNLQRLLGILDGLAARFDIPVVVSTHPRTRKRIEQLNHTPHAKVSFCKPFGFLDYVRLQKSARVVLSDSGTITEESSILNFPALNIRESHERPEGFEEAAVMMTGLSLERVMQAVDILADQPRGEQRLLHMVRDYQVDNVSDKVLRIILSYTDFVRRRVWHEA
ncbi:MAG: UDP-N-acetylglucosamine 2-epimerase (non-hydrolyzing) [Burkholderiaceae bacterium]|nr:UDP-N-acetylglucosamine 2-epimerase (non-hydrolyzing) [Burkholderiaceae bacterium]